MAKVLDESEWDDLLIEFEKGHGVEFANFSQEEVMYNIVKIDEQESEALERNIDLDIKSKDDIYITFRRDDTESVEKYWDEIENILAAIGSSRDGISAMELKNLN